MGVISAAIVTGLTAIGGGSAIVGGIIVAGATAGVVGSVNASNAAKKAAQSQQKAQQVQAKRQRRSAIRSNILASARARASAQSAGTAQSSGLAGGVGAGRSQLGAELGFGTQMSGLSSEISMFQTQAQRSSDIAGLGFGIANLGMSFAGAPKPEVAKTPINSNPSPLSGVS